MPSISRRILNEVVLQQAVFEGATIQLGNGPPMRADKVVITFDPDKATKLPNRLNQPDTPILPSQFIELKFLLATRFPDIFRHGPSRIEHVNAFGRMSSREADALIDEWRKENVHFSQNVPESLRDEYENRLHFDTNNRVIIVHKNAKVINPNDDDLPF